MELREYVLSPPLPPQKKKKIRFRWIEIQRERILLLPTQVKLDFKNFLIGRIVNLKCWSLMCIETCTHRYKNIVWYEPSITFHMHQKVLVTAWANSENRNSQTCTRYVPKPPPHILRVNIFTRVHISGGVPSPSHHFNFVSYYLESNSNVFIGLTSLIRQPCTQQSLMWSTRFLTLCFVHILTCGVSNLLHHWSNSIRSWLGWTLCLSPFSFTPDADPSFENSKVSSLTLTSFS